MTDELPELPAELKRLLAVERDAPPPSEMVQTAVLGDLRVTLSREHTASRFMRTLTPQLGFIAAFVLGVGAVFFAIRPRSPNEDRTHVQPLDAVPESDNAVPIHAAPRPVPLGTRSSLPPAPIARSPVLAPPLNLPTLPPPRPPSHLDASAMFVDAGAVLRDTSIEEDALLSLARSALSHHDANAAFAPIRLHLARFPDGRLTEEREALAIRALAMAGHDAEARARAQLFREAYPGSLFVRSIDDTLGPAHAPQ